jgi:hypothetical protein
MERSWKYIENHEPFDCQSACQNNFALNLLKLNPIIPLPHLSWLKYTEPTIFLHMGAAKGSAEPKALDPSADRWICEI